MIRRLINEESGMTMALAIMVMVIVGVMGAGLLIFVQRDLNSVVEVNQGQRALELADAGVEAARRHLATVDAKPVNYDGDAANGDSEWSELSAAAGGTGDGEKRIDFDDDGQNDIFVKIRFLTPSSIESETTQPDKAPEVLPTGAVDNNSDGYLDYPSNRNYFRVTVRGQAGSTVRQVQAIYRSQNFNIPVAFYATRDINFNGNATSVSNISLFARRCITNLRPERISGPDRVYGNWATNPITGAPNAYNDVPRTNPDGTTTDRAGAAALGINLGDPVPAGCDEEHGIDYDDNNENNKQEGGNGNPQRWGFRDVDRDSNTLTGSTNDKKFAVNTWDAAGQSQPTDTITFPIETGFADTNNDGEEDLIAELRSRAQNSPDGIYIRKPSGSSFNINDGTGAEHYPRSSNPDTVMFIEFAEDDGGGNLTYGTKGLATYRPRTSNADNLVKGTIVVVNGNLVTNSSADDFQGAFVVRDGVRLGSATDESQITKYDNGGSINLQGFLNVEGDISLRGNVDGLLPGELVNGINGVYSLTLWSWRECYNSTCG